MSTLNYQNQDGTTRSVFVVGGPTSGLSLKVNGSTLEVMNAAASSDVALTALSGSLSSATNQLVLGSSNTHPVTLSSGSPTATYTFTLPPTAGSNTQVLSTDGSGNTSWVSAASTASLLANFTATVTYASTFPYTVDTLPANAVVDHVTVEHTVAWNGTSPSLSVGITGTTSQWVGTGDNFPSVAGRYNCYSYVAGTSAEPIIISAVPGSGASAGTSVVTVWYYVPTA